MKTKILLSVIFLCTVLISNGQWTFTYLSEPKTTMGTASLGNKAYFAGGSNADGIISTVEVYDVTTGEFEVWPDIFLARSGSGGVACGSKVFFGGGSFSWESFSSRVDIYDTLTQQWSVESFSIPRFLPSALSYGNLVIFAGGLTDMYLNSTSVIEIYDMESGTWSTDNLSIERCNMGCAVVGDLAIFAGGFVTQDNISDVVDIYNFSSETWSTATLSEPRAFCEATTVGNKVLIAGGIKAINVPSKVVDIYDASTNTWSTDSLSVPRATAKGATVNGKAYFTGGATFNFGWHDYSDVVDIYDEASGTWSVHHMWVPRITNAVGVGEYLVIAGGELSATELTDLVEVLYDPEAGTSEPGVVSRQSSVVSNPNPTQGIVDFRWSIFDVGRVTLKLYNIQGKEVAVVLDEEMAAGEHLVRFNAESLPAGIYFYRFAVGGQRSAVSGKMVKY